MIPPRWLPLIHLIDARFREFIREPEAIFWVYGFPLILAVLLALAFRRAEPMAPAVDVQATPDLKRAEDVARHLADERWGTEKPKVGVFSEKECQERSAKGDSDLYLIVAGEEVKYAYDPARAESVQARYWIEALLARRVPENRAAQDPHIDSPGRRYIDFLLPGLIGTNIMGGGLFGVGFVLVDMRVRKLFKRLTATPMRHSDLLLSLIISRLMFLLPEMTSLLLIGYFGFDVPIRGSIVTLAVVILFGAVAFAGIGLLLGCRTEKTEAASGLMNMVMLPQYILSGVFFASTRYPAEAQPFIQALPLTQLNAALREVMLQGAGLLDVWWRIAILAAYAIVPFALALRWFKWR